MKQQLFANGKSFRFRKFANKRYSAFNSIRRSVTIGVLTGVALTALSTKPLGAQNKPLPSTINEKKLDEVVITASLAETPLEEVTRAITVITREEIQQAAPQSIQDLFVYMANVDLVQRGGHGVQADLSIRGGTFDQAAILINGINYSNAQTGHYNFDFPINISDIERIEILSEPSAIVYGANAFSGGINIITKQYADYKAHVSAEAGIHNLQSIEARGALNIKESSHSLSVGKSSSDGYIANSDYNIYNALWQSRFRLRNYSKIDVQLGYNDKRYGANTFYSAAYPYQYEQTSNYVASVKGEFGSLLKFVPAIYWNRHHDDFQLTKGSDSGRNFHRNDTYGAKLTTTYQWLAGTTSVATDIRRDEIMSSKLGKPMETPHRRYTKYDDRINLGIGLEHNIKINHWIFNAGALISHNTLEKDKYFFLPNVSMAYIPVEGTKINLSWSKSVRMPTFTDLYYSTETHIADESLKAEQSESVNLGISHDRHLFSVYANAYLIWGKNIIDWVKTSPDQKKWSSWNHSKLDNKGIEVGTKFHLGKLLPVLSPSAYIKLDYSQMYQNFDSKGLISIYSLNYMRSKVTAQFHHRIATDKLTATWFFRYQDRAGSYMKTEELAEEYKPYTTLDLKLNYRLNDLNLSLSMNNLYDTNYFDIGHIPQAGFWLMGGISYTFR